MSAKPDIKPIIIIDTREQAPLVFENLQSISGTLYAGDYSVMGLESLFSIERKSIDDLCGSLTSGRERFERELHRLRGYRFTRLLIEGTRTEIEQHRYRSRAAPKSILGSLGAFECRYGVPVVFAGDRTQAALLIERWAHYFTREFMKTASAVCAGQLQKDDP